MKTITPGRDGRIVVSLLTLLLLASCSAGAVEQATVGAQLLDAEQKAKQQTATVQVTVAGLELVDPDSVHAVAKAGQGHLHYRVDSGPVIATTTTKLSFHALTTGKHAIVISLVGNDHKPLGAEQTVAVVIP
jgi:hypothetical protein